MMFCQASPVADLHKPKKKQERNKNFGKEGVKLRKKSFAPPPKCCALLFLEIAIEARDKLGNNVRYF